MRVLQVVAGAVDPATELGAVDAVLLVVGLALTLLVVAYAFRAAARVRERPPGAEPAGEFTLMTGATWLQTAAVVLLALAVVILLWTVLLAVVGMA